MNEYLDLVFYVDGEVFLRERVLPADDIKVKASEHAQMAMAFTEEGREWRVELTDPDGEIDPLIMASSAKDMRAPVEITETNVQAFVDQRWPEDPLSDYDRENLQSILCGQGDWFTAMLLRLIAKADRTNRQRIRLGFPEVVAAFEEWERS